MLLTQVLAYNYGRVESRYPSENLLKVSLRRALNLAEDWFLSVVSAEDWEEKYKAILAGDDEEVKRLEEQRERWGVAEDGKPGEFVLERLEEQPEAPVINFGPAAP